jgi:hypothetical protein
LFSDNNDDSDDDNNNNNNNKDPDLLQNLLAPLQSLGMVVIANNGGRVEESQLTTGTGLGGDNNNEIDPKFMDSLDHHYSDDDSKDDDTHINDNATDKYAFNQHMHHYMEYSAISSPKVHAVEYCCMTQANTITCNGVTKGKMELDRVHCI